MLRDLPEDCFWAYVAGFFDGEGHLGTPVHGSCVMFLWKITQSGVKGQQLLDEIGQVFRERYKLAGSIRTKQIFPKPSNLIKKPIAPKDYYELHITKRASVEFIVRKLLPYLHIKRVVAQDLLRFCKLCPPLTSGMIVACETHCRRGHLITKRWKNKRYCVTCKRIAERAYRHRRRELRLGRIHSIQNY